MRRKKTQFRERKSQVEVTANLHRSRCEVFENTRFTLTQTVLPCITSSRLTARFTVEVKKPFIRLGV